MLEIGSLIDGKYKILNQVGQGGMSVVYLAMNEKANKQWAIKEVRKDGVLDFESVKQGLVAETDILKKLSHPYLPSIVDVIDMEDSFIIIMDYIQGNSLKQMLDDYGVLPQDKVIAWGKQLCDVLGYLHSQDPPIIYRDMKPANIMLKPDGNITLIDFGTAREFKTSGEKGDTTWLGTPGYAAPEQFGGRGQTDARTDIYGLGATLYHLVTGHDPSRDLTMVPIRTLNASLSATLEQIILKCTQADPKQRYQSAAELLYALENSGDDIIVRDRKLKRKIRWFSCSILMTFLCAGIAAWSYNSAEGKKKENYDFLLTQATNVQDYYDAIVADPTRTEAYLGTNEHEGLVDLLKKDDVITAEDIQCFTKLRSGLDITDRNGYSGTSDVLAQLEKSNPEGYHEVCYEVGETILFYYDIGVEKDKYAAAATWFCNAGDSYPLAKVYCDISDCLQSIAKFKKGGQLAKLNEAYTSLWQQISDLYQTASQLSNGNENLDMKMRIWNEIVKVINNNALELCDVTSRDEIIALIDKIADQSQQITTTLLQESVKNLQQSIHETKTKLNSIKIQPKEDG